LRLLEGRRALCVVVRGLIVSSFCATMTMFEDIGRVIKTLFHYILNEEFCKYLKYHFTMVIISVFINYFRSNLI
jgi:hypothetical protein